ncbi:MAG: hypothetical protein QOF68_3087 [Gaiellales bacterium]|jgi:2-keto-4-pentenoate hydratase/2-oxohepta-3-ene-1,7-dioic acid hydratase in catechol pathway|nr:hypothetical protein [Gaiellales bacterium]
MKLVRFGGGRTGVLEGDAVIDTGLAPGASWLPFIERQKPSLSGPVKDLASVALEAPLPDAGSRIFAMGGNFPMHLTEVTKNFPVPASIADPDSPPWGFFVIPGTIVGPGAAVSPPAGTSFFDYEAELAVILAGPDAEIWGYTGFNDFSSRDAGMQLSLVDHGPLTWSLQKNFATGNALGPSVVVGEAVDDVPISCRVNGELRQQDTSASMRFDFAAIATHIREYLPLRAGDILVSGTPGGTAVEYGPQGTRWLKHGDVTEVEVGEAGVLRNAVEVRAHASV